MPRRALPTNPYYEVPYLRYACPIGMTWDQPFTYQPPTNSAKREYVDDEDGWTTVPKRAGRKQRNQQRNTQ